MDIENYLNKAKQRNKDLKSRGLHAEVLDFDVPGWSATREDAWEEGLAKLTKYYEENQKLPTSKEAQGAWLHRQRRNFRLGKLSEDRKAALDLAIPSWLESSSWDVSLRKLVEVYTSLGRYPRDGEPGNRWLKTQVGKANNGTLSTSRTRKLDEALPGWVGKYEFLWEETLVACVNFSNTVGRLPKNKEFPWLSRQRSKYKQGSLSKELEKKLDEALPGWRDAKVLTWDERFVECVELANYLDVTPNTVQSPWLGQQKALYKGGKLSEEQVKRLDESLPGWATSVQNIWEDRLKECIDLSETLGRLPNTLESTWLSRQIVAMREGKLIPERIKKLDDGLPGWFKGSRTDPAWTRIYDDFLNLVDQKRSAPVG